MLTLYYVSATLVQSWRIQRTCKKITEQLAQSASIAFYTLQPGGEDGFDATFASSELCGNRNAAKVTDILWLHGNQRGCCLHPVQTLQITPWISFPAAPSWLPFAYASDTLSPVTTPTDNKLQPRVTLSTDSKQHLQLLLEARLEPQGDADSLETLAVRLEDYAVLREGNPQPFELLTNHVKRQSRNSAEIGAESWQKHLEDLRALGVLAHQANEFEQQKQRTESKLGMRSMEQSPVGNTKAIAVVEPTTKATSPAKVTAIKPLPSELEKIAASKAKPKPAEDSNKPIAAPSTPAPRKTTPTKTFVAVAPTSPPPVSASQGASGSRPRPILRRNKDSLGESKPLNVLVYSDSSSARDSVINTLEQLLERDVYTVYALTPQEAVKKFWLEQTALLVVCGSVSTSVGQILVDYFLHGGKVLSLCSDILHFVLPNYRTAEVREHELVQFSYDKWQRVKMMHHIFCYQPSPVKKHFSSDSEESTVATHSRNPSMEMKDLIGHNHKLDVQVLGSEETWNTPSIVLANSLQSGGKAIFSQVHLETSPSEFEFDEVKCSILKQNERTRLEIFAHLLRKYLDVDVQSTQTAAGAAPGAGIVYKQAYFLGRHESKFELLEKLGSRCSGSENVIVTPKLTLKFCGRDDKPPTASTNLLPILIHSCPDDFSTVDYFDCLKTEHIGRLVIYAPVISSSMNLINDLELMHGIVVLPLQQTAGMGRHNNQWLSPLGCAMFSTQLHISMDTPLAQRLPLLQHIIGAAIVNTLRSHPQYRVLDIALKWPNDIIANGNNKIGGLVVNTILQGSQAIVNIGSGINLNNSKPTVCINDVITQYNNRHPAANLPQLKYEQFMAFIFNEIERILAIVQNGHFDYFYNLYYDLWLHGEQSVRICLKNDEEKDATIVGIDDYGFLKVKLASGEIETVQPDGNSFDMLKGLIVPKYH
ncbi:biotin--protein ligase isoform X4 [Drosophila busckii]|uniref:biotin--protein ligase isoform X4 n=1 Tax=Drosophila busckii TaxID=30019 RepID=UPI00083EEB38|nr:biotin--protein ligase isoform X4 [Drosophila busckii]